MGLVSFNSLHTNDLDKHTINWYTHNTGGKAMNDEIQIQVLHQMFFELATKLMEDDSFTDSIPSNQADFIALVTARSDYKTRKQRDDV